MSWTALVPMKRAAGRKSRLAASLSSEARLRLADAMLRHALEVLGQSQQISRIAVLSEARPQGWAGTWLADGGRGLNPELDAAARELGPKKLLVILPDLPAVSAEDIAALIAAAAGGVAIAPDRHGGGTNAMALADASNFPFAFGQGSFARHRALAGPTARIVERPGLGLDIDTPDDLAFALALGLERPEVRRILSSA
jgi:2-phospho-L-lactate guanylyltransferase